MAALSLLRDAVVKAEQLYERLGPDRAEGYERLTVVPYLAHGNRDRAVLRGRVLDNRPLGPATRVEPVTRRTMRMARRFFTREVPGVRLAVEVGDASATTITDEEGYWHLELEGHGLPGDRLFHPVSVTPLPTRAVPVDVRPARVAVPTPRARRMVISDIDDTIMHSEAFDTSRLVKRTATGSAWTRRPFTGTGELFAGLERGPGLDEQNLVAYLSSSAWNLYDFLVAFLRRSAMPHGPLFLRDLGMGPGGVLQGDHERHKSARLAELFDMHDLPVVLVGDTGQHDAEIYRDVVAQHPDRVEAVLLRQVADEARRAEVEGLYADLDVPLEIAPDSTAFAARCEELGLVAPGWADRVAAVSA